MHGRYVSVYKEIRFYGGDEEGGWYYSVYAFVRVIKCSTSKSARRVALRIECNYINQTTDIGNKQSIGRMDNQNEPRPRYE